MQVSQELRHEIRRGGSHAHHATSLHVMCVSCVYCECVSVVCIVCVFECVYTHVLVPLPPFMGPFADVKCVFEHACTHVLKIEWNDVYAQMISQAYISHRRFHVRTREYSVTAMFLHA